MPSLRLLSFNIHGGRSLDGRRDLSRINRLMDRFSVDIGLFQEMETREAQGGSATDIRDLAGSERPHHFIGATMMAGQGWYGNLVISRYPILKSRLYDLETSASYEPRNAVDVLIDSPLGPLRVIGTHLSLSPLERWSEAQKLIKLMAHVEAHELQPVLLMGDINEWQWPSRLIRFLNRAMTPVSCRPTFPAWCPFLRLDRIWHSAPTLTIRAHRLSGQDINRLSDHLPVLIECMR